MTVICTPDGFVITLLLQDEQIYLALDPEQILLNPCSICVNIIT